MDDVVGAEPAAGGHGGKEDLQLPGEGGGVAAGVFGEAGE